MEEPNVNNLNGVPNFGYGIPPGGDPNAVNAADPNACAVDAPEVVDEAPIVDTPAEVESTPAEVDVTSQTE